jgi:hypothetical protein
MEEKARFVVVVCLPGRKMSENIKILIHFKEKLNSNFPKFKKFPWGEIYARFF